MNQRPSLSQSPRCRVIVDNDFSGDPDGLVGLAHHLLSPTNRVVAITSSFVTKFPVPAPLAEDGAVAARELLDVVGGSQHIPVHAGSEEPLLDVESSTYETTAADGAARRTYTRVGFRLLVGDLLARLRMHNKEA
jgi:purine nucleosidase